MNFFTAIRVALAALLVNKVRSALTILGILIGIGAVIAMVSAGNGAHRKLDDGLEKVGKNLILIRAGARTKQGSVSDFTPLSRDDAAAIRKQVGPLLIGVAEMQITQRIVASRTNNWPTVIVGCTPEMQVVRQWQVNTGRYLTDDDVKKLAGVCCIGQTACRKLFPDTPDPLGHLVRVDSLQLRVIGVLEAKGRAPTGADLDDQIFIPITTLQRKLVGEEKVSMILTSARSRR